MERSRKTGWFLVFAGSIGLFLLLYATTLLIGHNLAG
jgi:hypothetical protein